MIYPEYESPIQMVMGDMEMQIEEHCVRAVQRAGFNVDAESLRQALENDSQRYREAYRKGYAQRDSEIVRCRDCKKSRLYQGEYDCMLTGYGEPTTADWFCGDGERKEDDTE